MKFNMETCRFWKIDSRKRIQKAVLVLLALLLLSTVFKPVRNLLLYSVWPRSWRALSTFQVLKIVFLTDTPSNVTDITKCLWKTPPIKSFKIDSQNPFQLHQSYAPLTPQSKLFLPQLTANQKYSLLTLYNVAEKLLNKAGVEFYFVFGSLLGVYRHRGIIPWDDDIDIAIDVKHWQNVRQALSCVEGYSLRINPIMHWKFTAADNQYPFIDIFFMTEDDQYTWPIVDYSRSEVFNKKDIYPIKYDKFEDLTVPIPQDIVKAVDVTFDAIYCQSPSIHHKSHTPLPNFATIPCADLMHMYTMYI